ncbi:hypothetical protein [Mucilaginibacter sp. CSA2-8R]|uniref:hypothetical protein n=1 Tax=Mucilaginibacter sp. CSA2-8R TaxID=3141542 RepID=UPI00315DDDA4
MNPMERIFGNHAIYKAALPTFALFLMLASILFPAVNNSMKLENPTASQLLITICVSLFASVIYLWILDATGILPFKNEWISKSVYGAAIVSILGTSVGVYKDYFQSDKYPMRGRWNISISVKNKQLADNELNLSYSESSKAYYGYSNINTVAYRDSVNGIIAVEIKKLSLNFKTIHLVCYNKDGNKTVYNNALSMTVMENQITCELDSVTELAFIRPN